MLPPTVLPKYIEVSERLAREVQAGRLREGEKLKTSIKELMEKANITEAKLAEQADVPIQTIKYLVEGRYNPSLALAYRIADVLKCKIEDLFKLA